MMSLCLLAPLVSPLLAQQVDEAPLEGSLGEGVKLIGLGRFQEAVQALNDAKQRDLQDARPYFYCGMALSQSGHMQDAASELVEAVHLAPQRLEYRVFQAHVFEELKQMEAADATLAAFKDAQVLARLSAAWLRLLADDFYRLEEPDKALPVLALWEKSDPGNPDVDLNRGRVYLLKMRPDVALESFEQSVKKSSQNPQAFYEMAKILYSKNEYLAAKDALLKALRVDANNPEYISKLASVYLALDDPDAAIKSLRGIESAAPGLPMIYYIMARALRKQGDAARSAEYFAKFQEASASERDGNERALQISRPIAQAERQLDQGHTAEARALFEKALLLDPNRWEPNANLAEMDLNSGDTEGAYPRLERLQQIDPESPVGNFLMARYWYQKKDYAHARIYAEKVRVSRPDNSECRALLGDIYTHLGERQKALQEYQAAIHLAPDRTDLRQRLENAEGKRQ